MHMGSITPLFLVLCSFIAVSSRKGSTVTTSCYRCSFHVYKPYWEFLNIQRLHTANIRAPKYIPAPSTTRY